MKKLGIGCLAVIGAFVVIGVIIAALSAGGSDSDTSPTTASDNSKSSASDKGASSNKPKSATKGMEVGNWKVIGKIKIKSERYGGDAFTTTFRVRNTSDQIDQPFFTVNVLKGEDILGSLDCSGGEVGGGQIGTVDCFTTDKYQKGWTEVTIENSF